MNIRLVTAIATVTAGLFVSASAYAAPSTIPAPVHAMFAKGKTVKLAVRNDSGSAMELKVGEQTMSLEVGKTLALQLPVGTRILVNSSTATHKAGDLVAEVSTDLSNMTIALK
ncbi:MAG TPA: hypothetical protein VGN01_13275 [Acidobacteriaceae bacterium]|jgi:hypothetical protein